MKLPYRYRPSAGFLFLVASGIAVILFLAWGFAQPDLDRAWWGAARLEREPQAALTEDEAAALKRSLERYPDLAGNLGPDGRAVAPPAGAEAAVDRDEGGDGD